MKKLKLLVSFLVFSLFAANVSALSSEDLLIRAYGAKAVAEHNDYNDASLIKVTYVGVGTQAAVGVTATAFTTEVPIGTVDLNLDISAVAYDTLGELCDYLQGLAAYNCSLTGGKRDDSSGLLNNVTAAVATDAKAASGYSVLIDTGGAVATDPYFNRIGITPETGKRVVLKYCIQQTDATGSIRVYGKLGKFASGSDGVTRNDTTLITSIATVDDTAKTVGNIYSGNWLEFAKNEHVVISAGNAATSQTATSYLECFWDEK